MKFLVVSLAFCAVICQLYAQGPTTPPPTPEEPTRNPIKKLEDEIKDIQEGLHKEIAQRAYMQMCSLPAAARMFENGLKSLLSLGDESEKRGFDLSDYEKIEEMIEHAKEAMKELEKACRPHEKKEEEEKEKEKELLEMRNLLERFLKVKSRRSIK